MYYLKSRYYDPEVCRFINADAFVSTGQGIIGYNMFAYCGNNPVNGLDSRGTYFNPIIVNDGGSLYSSEDLAILQIIREFFPDIDCASAPLHCSMSQGTYYSSGFGSALLSLLKHCSSVGDIAGIAAGSFSALDYIGKAVSPEWLSPATVYLFLADFSVKATHYVTEKTLYFSNVPALDRGNYNVLYFDLTISRQSYTNGATGERETNEYHQVIRVFIDQNGKYSSHTSYYVDTVYRG